MDIMYHRKNGKRYEVYQYVIDNGHVCGICYDTEQAGRQCGQGWSAVRLKDLIPEAHANKITGQFMSTTERNKIKNQLTMTDAIWKCTDGLLYDHAHLEDAIEHQRQLGENLATAKRQLCESSTTANGNLKGD